MIILLFVLTLFIDIDYSFSQSDSITLRIDSLLITPCFKSALDYRENIKYFDDSIYKSISSTYDYKKIEYPPFYFYDTVICFPPYYGKFPNKSVIRITIPISNGSDEIVIEFKEKPQFDTVKISKLFHCDYFHYDTSLVFSCYFPLKNEIMSSKSIKRREKVIINKPEFKGKYPEELTLTINDKTYMAKCKINFHMREIWTGSGYNIPRNYNRFERRVDKNKRVLIHQVIEYKYKYKATYLFMI